MPPPPADAKALSLLSALFVAFLCAVFGANTVAIKFSLNGLGVFTTAAVRFGLASMVIFMWTAMTRQPIAIQKGQLPKLLIITLIFFVQLSLFYMGISKTFASRGTLLANIQPFFVLFLAHFFIAGDRITKQKLVGILLGFSGVTFVFLERAPLASELKTGDLLILVAAFIWACNGVYTKQILKDLNPLQVVVYPALFSAPLFFSAAVATGELNMIQSFGPVTAYTPNRS
jgi:drug/metabolite transporter (DMT)-like permease